jgi:hypothetical protein
MLVNEWVILFLIRSTDPCKIIFEPKRLGYFSNPNQSGF